MAHTTIPVHAATFSAEVLKSDRPVLVDFWASWCGPCLMMEPVLEELADELHDRLKITKLNTESPDEQQLAMLYRVQSIPNMKLFKDGKVIAEFIGYRPKDVLKQELEEALQE
ncbi:MAG: Thioredoxin-1 [candidate division WS6 bacterium OLB20]|uniref:Thioredoxin n=1 Tax=candidate division WS6 bacterium OLB20 TaxID=1617426 RepID=A0A136LVN3_9BACT|nr:MAG: Thioredoxin-1 [candidate division WS6 bacterium OLB20]